VIIGTAGHIDHGKSALVAALTGQAMDRLAEERRRGITIDLNFAPLQLGGGQTAGVVDVPGHEDFVRTMVAGASGIDLAILVVAADEGIMPQTLEHLAVLEHLGVEEGIPVVTKADLVDPDWLDLVAAEVAERVSRSPVRFESPLAVSAKTGQGLDELRSRLTARAQALKPTRAADLFRMPVDRAFSMAGVGTVVTGTAWSGRLAIGDAVRLLPSGVSGRVRSIESYGATLEQSVPGARTAVGIAGIQRDQGRRGEWLVAADSPWMPVRAVDVVLALAPEAPRALTARTRVRVHLGTAEVMARVQPRGAIEPGARGLARLTLESPVVARGGDRLVIRSYSPVTTIGGGRVLDPSPPPRRAAWPEGLAAEDGVAHFTAVLERRPGGISTAELPVLLGRAPAEAAAVARAAPGVRLVGDLWVRESTLAQLGDRALSLLKAHHRARPSDRGLSLETLRRGLRAPDTLAELAVNDLASAGRIRVGDGVAMLSGFVPRVEGGDAEIDRVVRILEEADLTPPTLDELAQQTGRRDVAAILRLAAQAGKVEAVERERYYARPALDRFTATLTAAAREGPVAPSVLRERLGISRKFLIPLLEWADAKGITERVGDARKLRNA
jgi:selenocysteine-specific elongation factor